ncbi:MAG: ABC transporter substrate-binding protein, partial [Anaerolineae bacterium]|nr:ABC transporter substrate-binding protein [Anaerolineae bacterium]
MLARVQAAGVLRVAVDPSFTPFETVTEQGQLAGFDIDLAQNIAFALGVDVHFVTTNYDALYDALTVGRADIIISALYPDPSRTSSFTYSTSYFNAGDVLLVSKNSSVAGLETLGGQRVACIYGTAGHMAVLKMQHTLTPKPIVITANTPHTLTNALAVGNVDAVILDHVTALAAEAGTPAIHILPVIITDEPYVVAARIEDETLMNAIDTILTQMHADGSMQHLIDKW